MDLPITTEQLLSVIFLLMALAVAVGALRGNLRWARWQKEQRAAGERQKRRTGYGGPWGD